MRNKLSRSTTIILTVLAVLALAGIGAATAMIINNTRDHAQPEPLPTVESTPATTNTQSPDPTAPAWQPSATATTSSPDPDEDLPDAATLDRADMTPEDVVIAAARIMTTWDTTEDASPTEGYRRALPLFVDEYDELFTVPENPTLPADWREASNHNAVSTSRAEVTDTYDEGGTITLYVLVTWTWHGDNNWSSTPDPARFTFQIAKENHGPIINNWTDGELY